MQKIIDIFFSPEGRIPRGLWWGSVVVLSLLYAPIILPIKKYAPELYLPIALILGIPGIFLNAKRFHDRNKSAWWFLLGVVPVIGPLWIFIECGCLAGTLGPNRFGFPELFGSESRLMKEHANHRVEPTRHNTHF
jgi:uncharacterized membrane protein YhaH (DUF805 family)